MIDRRTHATPYFAWSQPERRNRYYDRRRHPGFGRIFYSDLLGLLSRLIPGHRSRARKTPR